MALPNVVVQPHHGAATIEAREAIGRLVIENIAARIDGRPLPTPVI
jgi:D-3-phosphoglycerate dehydrogenase